MNTVMKVSIKKVNLEREIKIETYNTEIAITHDNEGCKWERKHEF